jgi:hypothetical protein
MHEDEKAMDMRMAEKLAKLRQQDGFPARRDSIHGGIAQVREQLETLTRKLEPVLREENPQPAAMLQSTRTPGISELTGFLTDTAQELETITRLVRELAERVDL